MDQIELFKYFNKYSQMRVVNMKRYKEHDYNPYTVDEFHNEKFDKVDKMIYDSKVFTNQKKGKKESEYTKQIIDKIINQSNEKYTFTNMKIDFQKIDVSLSSDKDQQKTPILLINLEQIKLEVIECGKTLLQGDFNIQVQFNNLIKGQYEPVLEKTSIQAQKISYQKNSYTNIELKENEIANFNLSENLIIQLNQLFFYHRQYMQRHIYHNQQIKNMDYDQYTDKLLFIFDRQYQEEYKEQIHKNMKSSIICSQMDHYTFTVDNQIGHDIYVLIAEDSIDFYDKNSTKTKVPSQSQKDIILSYQDYSQVYQSKTKEIFFVFLDLNGNPNLIDNQKADFYQKRVVKFYGIHQSKFMKRQSSIQILDQNCDSYLQQQSIFFNNKLIIKFQSKLVFNNQTNCDFELVVVQDDRQFQISLGKNSKKYLSNQIQKSRFVFKNQNGIYQDQKEIGLIEIQQDCECFYYVQIGKKLFGVRVKQKAIFDNQIIRKVVIQDPICIENTLPVEVSLNLIVYDKKVNSQEEFKVLQQQYYQQKGCELLTRVVLSNQKQYFFNEINIKQYLALQINIEGYQGSQFVEINYQNKNYKTQQLKLLQKQSDFQYKQANSRQKQLQYCLDIALDKECDPNLKKISENHLLILGQVAFVSNMLENDFDILVFSNKREEINISRNQKEDTFVSLSNDHEQYYLQNKYDDSFISSIFQIKELNEQFIELKRRSEQEPQRFELVEYTIHIQMKRVSNNQNLFMKCVSILPRYVLLNYTDYLLSYKQSGVQYFQQIDKNGRLKKELNIKIKKNKVFESEWSEDISLIRKQITKIYLLQKKQSVEQFDQIILNDTNSVQIQIEIRVVNNVQYIVISNVDEIESDYMITNLSSHFMVEVQQVKSQYQGSSRDSVDRLAEIYRLKKKQSYHIFQRYGNRQLQVFLRFFRKEGEGRLVDKQFINIEEFQEQLELRLEGQTVFVKNVNQDNQKRILIYDGENENGDDGQQFQNKEWTNNTHYVNLNQVGFSVILNHRQLTKELLYIYIGGLELCQMQRCNKYNKHNKFVSKEIQCKIQFLNIDNNSSEKTLMPVVLTKQNRNYQEGMIDFLIQYKEKPDMVVVENLQLQFANTSIKLEEYLLLDLIDYIYRINKMIEKNVNNIDLSSNVYTKNVYPVNMLFIPQKVNRLLERNSQIQKYNKQQNPFANWTMEDIQKNNKQIYIINMEVPLILLELSYYKTNIKQNSDEILSFFGFLMKNLNEAHVEVSGFQVRNTYIQNLNQLIIQHYKYQFLMSIIQILGNADIIGNPLRTIEYVRMGVVNLFSQIKEGFHQGPIPFVKSLGLGINFLLIQTCLGIFNSVQKVTSSVANGLQILSLDQQYIEERHILMIYQPLNFVEGMSQALEIFQFNFKQMVEGLILTPLNNMIKQDFKMFLVSIYSGVTGLVFKPMIATLDSSSTLFLGFKNQILTLQNIGVSKRIRIIRPFYESSQYLKTYHLIDAKIIQLYNRKAQKTDRNLEFIGSVYVFDNQKKENQYIALIQNQLWIIDAQISKIIRKINMEEIIRFNIFREIEIFVRQKNKQYTFQIQDRNESDCPVINKLNMISQIHSDTNEFC